jgi:hypothetical protein
MFYHESSDVSAELDTLVAVTHFGPGQCHFDDRVPDPVLDETVCKNRFLKGLRPRGSMPHRSAVVTTGTRFSTSLVGRR